MNSLPTVGKVGSPHHHDPVAIVVSLPSTTYTYNALDQVLSKSYAGDSGLTPAVIYTYSKGWLTGITAGSQWSLNNNQFDAIGRVTQMTQSINGTQYIFSATYKPQLGVATLTYPVTGRTVTTTYDSAGRPSALTGQLTGNPTANYVTSTSYWPDSGINTQTLANNSLTYSRTENDWLQPATITAATSGGTALLSLAYNYNPGGNVAQNNGNLATQTITRSAAAGNGSWTQTYGYSEPGGQGVNRLTSASEVVTATSAANWTQNSGYDPAGNRWVTYVSGLPAPTAETPTSQSWYISGGATSNRINSWGYDVAGNVTGVGGMGRSFTFDAENRMVTATINSVTTLFSYDSEGRRIQKLRCPLGQTACTPSTSGAQQTVYVYDPFGNLAQEYTNQAPPATASTQYLIPDALGSTRLVTDGGANPLKCYDYTPFGEEILAGYGRPTGTCFNSSSTYPAGDGLTAKFTGLERDPETGLDNFISRYFSGPQGRFTGADDPLMDQDPSNPQSWNLYLYGRNNPLRYSDPTGRKCVQTSNGPADDGTGGGCDAAGVDSNGTITPQQITVGVGRDEANLIMLSLIGERLSSPHQIGTVVSGGIIGAVDAWSLGNVARSGWSLLKLTLRRPMTWVEMNSLLRRAATTKGFYDLGEATAGEADVMGQAWVGSGAKVATDGKTLVSADGLRQYRAPSYKQYWGVTQANFESRVLQGGKWQSNGHLTIHD